MRRIYIYIYIYIYIEVIYICHIYKDQHNKISRFKLKKLAHLVYFDFGFNVPAVHNFIYPKR